MTLKTKFLTIAILLGVITVALIGCGTEEPEATATSAPEVATEPPDEPTTAPEPQLEGDAVRGGLMYDKWWTVIEADTPESDHPLWSTQTTNTRSGADTWRCKECHGWDYKGADGAYGSGSHFTGFVGVFASMDNSAATVLAAMKGETSADHDFSSVMSEQDLIDLSLFITEGTMDYDELINADATSQGNATDGQVLYEEVCTKCHGPAGNAINFGGLDDPEFLGHLAPDNPWEFVHKVRFGQPGWPMPSAITNGWSNEDVANVLAYAQGFTSDPFVSGGGQLYDKWWEVAGVDVPEGDNPLWSTQTTNTREGADTWRCKECHGWDYLGAEGAYGSGSHFTGFVGVLGAASMSSEELLAWLNGQNNADHDFAGSLDEVFLNALVAFMQTEMADFTAFINEDKSVEGDPAIGRELFTGTCAACHGTDGKRINFGDADDPEFLGTVAADNPWEFFHKVSFGQPGEPMPSGLALGWTLEEIADLAAYAQTLPTE